MTHKTAETTASISVYELDQICKEVDRELKAELSGVFAQKRTYKKAAAYAGALGDPAVLVKSCWGMAEGAGNETPGQFQSLIGENKWASEEMWDGIAVTAERNLGKNAGGDPLGPGMVVDETADEKRGKHTAGVSRQYAGCAGGIINCVTWVMMSFICPRGKTWISGRTFLPEKTWFTGEGATGTVRREKAGYPVKPISRRNRNWQGCSSSISANSVFRSSGQPVTRFTAGTGNCLRTMRKMARHLHISYHAAMSLKPARARAGGWMSCWIVPKAGTSSGLPVPA